MAKFNKSTTRPAVSSPVKSEQIPSGTTFEGAPGYARDAKSELFLLAVTNMVGEPTFYEGASDRDNRYGQLVRDVAVADPTWMAGFLPWLRNDANIRSASLVGALEAAKAMVAASVPGARQLVNAVLQRADEPGEALAYWTSTYGRAIPKPVKRGVADAVQRLYGERSLLKYDTASKGFRFGDVLDLVHPTPSADWQGELFKFALDRRHGRDTIDNIPSQLWMIREHVRLRAADDPTEWLDPQRLHSAGMTWEDALSAVGSKVDKAKLWEAMIPSMGYMALLRNLRNFDEAGVNDARAATVAARLSDPEQVSASRQLPMRFLSAYKAAPSLRWSYPLEQALDRSLANIPELGGRTLILVDRSGSMFGTVSERSGLNRADTAAVFGVALAKRAADASLVQFGTRSQLLTVGQGESLLRAISRFANLGGTNTADAVRSWYDGHDRVVIVTDEQAWGGYYGGNPTEQVPANVPVYTWNLAGYERGHGPSGSANRHTFGGLSDAAFRMIPLLEAGRNAAWPWEAAS